MKIRLRKLAGSKLNSDDEVIIFSQIHRLQNRNREEARLKLAQLILKATFVPKIRKKTKATKSSKEKRHLAKRRRSVVKSNRKGVDKNDY